MPLWISPRDNSLDLCTHRRRDRYAIYRSTYSSITFAGFASSLIMMSWRACYSGLVTEHYNTIMRRSYLPRRAESMSGGQVVRSSPLHYDKNGTVINRRQRFSIC